MVRSCNLFAALLVIAPSSTGGLVTPLDPEQKGSAELSKWTEKRALKEASASYRPTVPVSQATLEPRRLQSTSNPQAQISDDVEALRLSMVHYNAPQTPNMKSDQFQYQPNRADDHPVESPKSEARGSDLLRSWSKRQSLNVAASSLYVSPDAVAKLQPEAVELQPRKNSDKRAGLSSDVASLRASAQQTEAARLHEEMHALSAGGSVDDVTGTQANLRGRAETVQGSDELSKWSKAHVEFVSATLTEAGSSDVHTVSDKPLLTKIASLHGASDLVDELGTMQEALQSAKMASVDYASTPHAALGHSIQDDVEEMKVAARHPTIHFDHSPQQGDASDDKQSDTLPSDDHAVSQGSDELTHWMSKHGRFK